MTDRTMIFRERALAVDRVMEARGEAVTLRDVNERLAVLGLPLLSGNSFLARKDRWWPNWREHRRAAKQLRIITSHSGPEGHR